MGFQAPAAEAYQFHHRLYTGAGHSLIDDGLRLLQCRQRLGRPIGDAQKETLQPDASQEVKIQRLLRNWS